MSLVQGEVGRAARLSGEKIGLCLWLILALQSAQAQQPPKPPSVQILSADVFDRHTRDGRGTNAFTIKGVSPLKVIKTSVTMEEDGTGYAVYLTTDKSFTLQDAYHAVIRVGNQILIPSEWGGRGQDVNNTIDFRALDRATAEVFNGTPFSAAPKDSLKIEYTPDPAGSPGKNGVYTTIVITNVSDKPVTFFWGTTGGGNYPCRDTQLAFSASRDGVPTLPNPKPLPPGFISSPLTIQPKSFLRRHENLKEWLQLDEPGKYLVSAAYTLNIQNPVADTSPRQWSVVYQNQFSVVVPP